MKVKKWNPFRSKKARVEGLVIECPYCKHLYAITDNEDLDWEAKE